MTNRIGGKFKSSAVTVTTAATALPTTPVSGRITQNIRNKGAQTLYIGGSDVTVANGFPIEPGEAYPVDVNEGAILYGIVASGTASVKVLEGV